MRLLTPHGWLFFPRSAECEDRAKARAARTVTLLIVLSILNAADLAFTNSQLVRGNFAEQNAVAAHMVVVPEHATAYKSVLFALGAGLLYLCRRAWTAEAAVWGVTIVYAALMWRWSAYLDAVEECLHDVAVVTQHVAF